MERWQRKRDTRDVSGRAVVSLPGPVSQHLSLSPFFPLPALLWARLYLYSAPTLTLLLVFFFFFHDPWTRKDFPPVT